MCNLVHGNKVRSIYAGAFQGSGLYRLHSLGKMGLKGEFCCSLSFRTVGFLSMHKCIMFVCRVLIWTAGPESMCVYAHIALTKLVIYNCVICNKHKAHMRTHMRTHTHTQIPCISQQQNTISTYRHYQSVHQSQGWRTDHQRWRGRWQALVKWQKRVWQG